MAVERSFAMGIYSPIFAFVFKRVILLQGKPCATESMVALFILLLGRSHPLAAIECDIRAICFSCVLVVNFILLICVIWLDMIQKPCF